MSEEFKDFTATPTLTLNPVAEESAVPAMAQETRVQPNEAGWDDSMLSAEEKQMVVDFSKQIDLKNSNLIMQYGAGAQKKMADFSEKALDNVISPFFRLPVRISGHQLSQNLVEPNAEQGKDD